MSENSTLTLKKSKKNGGLSLRIDTTIKSSIIDALYLYL